KRARGDLDRFSARVGGEKAELRQQGLQLEDREAELKTRQENARVLEAKVQQNRSEAEKVTGELDGE
ncbi:unnamed protein product, partial [Ectocarpus sp. 8 AP-2014]